MLDMRGSLDRGFKLGPFVFSSKTHAMVLVIVVVTIIIVMLTAINQIVLEVSSDTNVTRSEAARIARDYMGGGMAGLAQLSIRGEEYVWIVEITTFGMRTRYYDVYVCAMTGDVLNTQQTFRDRER